MAKYAFVTGVSGFGGRTGGKIENGRDVCGREVGGGVFGGGGSGSNDGSIASGGGGGCGRHSVGVGGRVGGFALELAPDSLALALAFAALFLFVIFARRLEVNLERRCTT